MKNKLIFLITLFLSLSLSSLVSANLVMPNEYVAATFNIIIVSFLITLVLEFLVAFIYTHITKIKKNIPILISVLLLNIISVPITWFLAVSVAGLFSYVLPPLISNIIFYGFLNLIFAEIFAVLFEGYFIFLFNKKRISLKKSFILSIIMNMASLFIGGLFISSYLLYFRLV